MGTSGAYGGSRGWNATRDDTSRWLQGLGGEGTGTDGIGGGGDPSAESPDSGPAEDPERPTSQPPSAVDPGIARIFAGVARKLRGMVGSGGSSTAGGGGGTPRGGGQAGARGGGTGRRRAAAAGGAAIAGVYGLKAREAGVLSDIGLSLDDLDGLSLFEKARRIVDAATGPDAPLEEDELREVNAEFVWRMLERDDDEPSAPDLVKAWVVELVFHTWLTEAGSILRDGSRDGQSTHSIEREARATLETAVNRVDLPIPGIRAADFQQAVASLLGTLSRIFGEAAA